MLRLTLILVLISPPLFAASPVWKVEKGQHALFIGGTVHILRPQDFPLPDSFNAAYNQSDRIIFETDIGATQSASFQANMIAASRLPPGQTLSKLISPDTAKKLNRYLQQQGMSLDMFEGMRPFMVSLSLTIAELQKLGVSASGVDHHFYRRAQQDDKTIIGLETIDQQLEFLAHTADGEEDLVIRQTLEELKTLPQMFADLIDSWRSGDMKRMKALLIDTMQGEFDPVYQRLVVDRNNNWMPQMEIMLNDESVELVLVGAAHLAGPDGLLEQLKQKGYRVQQLD